MIQFLLQIRNRNEVLFYFSMALLAGLLISLVLQFSSSLRVEGVNAWLKPTKFFISIFIFVFSMALYMVHLEDQSAVKIYSWVCFIGLSYELLVICGQAFRGKMSHFNVETPFDNALFISMGVVIVVVTLWTAYIGFLFFTQTRFSISDQMVWAIRFGIILTVIFAFEGGLMGSRLSHAVGGPDGGAGIPFLNWSKSYGDLRVGHFIGLHALQVIPLFGLYIAKESWHVVAFSMVNLALAVYTLFRALAEKSILNF